MWPLATGVLNHLIILVSQAIPPQCQVTSSVVTYLWDWNQLGSDAIMGNTVLQANCCMEKIR